MAIVYGKGADFKLKFVWFYDVKNQAWRNGIVTQISYDTVKNLFFQCIKEADLDHDGKINLDEFEKATE